MGLDLQEPRGSLNASSAFVTVNMSDASVFIYTGGVEMGQGLYTKLAQLASNALGIRVNIPALGATTPM